MTQEKPIATTEPQALSRGMWLRLALLVGAVLFLHWHTLTLLVTRWYHEPDYTYGFFVPLVSLYLVWMKREKLLRAENRPSLWGAPVVAGALLLQFGGTVANIGYFQGVSLVILIAGLALLLGGRQLLLLLVFPIMYLWLMVPLPGAVYSALAGPLQRLASLGSVGILEVIGVPVYREGNVFRLAGISLEVAEACSGLRSLIGLLSMGILLGYLITDKLWERIVLALSTIVIAVVANILRVAGTGILYEYAGPKYGQGFYHGFGAWIVFVIALAVLFVEASLLSALFIEEQPVSAESADGGEEQEKS